MVYKRKIGGEYEFTDREGRLVRSTKEGLKPIGKAYGFLDCKASKEKIEAELLNAREIYRAPSDLVLSLTEDVGNRADSDLLRAIGADRKIGTIFPSRLRGLIKKAKSTRIPNLRYMVEATKPDATNEETADELGEIMAGLNYAFSEDGPFTAVIASEKEGEYVFRE